MSKIEYAKFQFMILVLKSLEMILILLTSTNMRQDANHLIGEMIQHEYQIKDLMEEK